MNFYFFMPTLFLVCFVFLSKSTAQDESYSCHSCECHSDRLSSSNKKLRTAIALNQTHAALHTITEHNDILTLEEQYSEVVNNIDLCSIEDSEVLELLRALLDTLNKYRLKEQQQNIIQRNYEEKIENAVFHSMSMSNTGDFGSVELTYTEEDDSNQSNSTEEEETDFDLNSVLVQISNPLYYMNAAAVGYSKYHVYRESISQELRVENFAIAEELATELTSIRSKFMQTYWTLMKKHDIPDNLRLTENQFSYLSKINGNPDIEARYRTLKKAVANFQAYPKAIYYLAETSLKLGYKEEARSYFKKVEFLDLGILRNDNVLASTYMHLSTLAENKAERLAYIDKMLKESVFDGRRNIFAALVYIDVEQYTKASELLQINLDNREFFLLSAKYKSLLAILMRDDNEFDHNMTRLVKNGLASGEDILYTALQHPKLRKLEFAVETLGEINVQVEEGFWGDLTLVTNFPKRWIKNISKDDLAILKYDSKSFTPSAPEVEEGEESIILSFSKAFFKDILNGESKIHKFGLLISNEKHPILLNYELKVEHIVEEGFVSKGLGKLQNFDLASDYQGEIADAKANLSTQFVYDTKLVNINLLNSCVERSAESWKKCH